jgi:trimeric autotransporter adhesin
MRRFLTLVCLLCVAIPAGISISGCTRNPAGAYCNGLGYGLKNTDVASIFLSPQTTGMSLAFGQTQQVSSPTSKTCKGTPATVATYTYGTTNNQLVDISPTGNICAGTWNRNSGGGIPNFTICNFPNPLPATGGLPYATAYVTASASSVTSNPVEVYVHALVTSVTLEGPQACLSQGALAQLDAQACFVGTNNQQQLLCAPPSVTTAANPNLACALPPGVSLSAIPDCTASLGTLTYTVGTASIASINGETNQITAEQPGTTVITASVAGGASSAGYFSTCPPASISVTLADGGTVGTITQGVQQNLTTTVYDTNINPSTGLGNPITGLTLDYQSTDPIDITATPSGSVTTNFPGVASVYAICQPTTCNPSPINVTGLNGTGLSISSNRVTITVPGTASDFAWFSSPGQSQYFVPIELLSGTVGSTVRLPYVPNSMVMDRNGTDLYFGSPHELMYYATSTNTLSKQDPNAPGVVLAVSPNNAQLLINDQVRQVFYLYTIAGGISSTFGGMGTSAAWTPDAKTLYITDSAAAGAGHSDTLYVFNVNSGWTSYPLAASGGANPGAQSVAITIPGVGAYLSGNPTVAHTWCPQTINGGANILFYPQGDSVDALTDVLAATTDGEHILGAALSGGGVTLSDIGITIPTDPVSKTPATCPVSSSGALSPLTITHTLNQVAVSGVNATAVNQVVPAPNSTLAFITYDGDTAGASLPYYVTGSGGAPGTVSYVTLNGSSAITAPLTGAFTPDDALFFVGTAGDNLVHYISVPQTVTAATPPTDTQQIAPNLPSCVPVSAGGTDIGCTYSGTGSVVPVTAIAVKPRSTT